MKKKSCKINKKMFSLLLSLSASSKTELELSKTGQHHFLVVEGTEITLKVVKKYTLIVFNTIGACTVNAFLSGSSDKKPLGEIQFANTNFSGIWTGPETGHIKIASKETLTINFVYAILSDDCDAVYVTNTRKTVFSIKPPLEIQRLYYFNAVFGSYNYKVSYDLSENETLKIIRNDKRLREYKGDNRFTGMSMSDDPVVLQLFTNVDDINGSVNMESTSNDIISDANLTFCITGSNLSKSMYLFGGYNDDKYPEVEDQTAGLIVTISLLVIFGLCII